MSKSTRMLVAPRYHIALTQITTKGQLLNNISKSGGDSLF